MAEYISIAAGEKFQPAQVTFGLFRGHCSHVSAAIPPRFCDIAAAF